MSPRLLILLMFILLLMQAGVSKSVEAEDFRLDKTTSRIETFVNTTTIVWHMEEDRSIPGNILYSEISRMKTTDGNTTTTVIDSASSPAHFLVFHQLNDTLIVSTDIALPCLRLIDRTIHNRTTTLAGLCSNSGYGFEDGSDAKFQSPRSIILDVKNASRLLVSDRRNNAIREVNINSGFVGTFYKAGTIHGPEDIYQDSVSGDLYITTNYSRIYILRYDSFAEIQISSTSDGYFDGKFRSARFYTPSETVLVNERTVLLVADHNNNRLRIMDLLTNTTTSLCTGEDGHIDGDLASCSTKHPRCLLIVGDTLYIGEAQRIRMIKAAAPTTVSRVTVVRPLDETTMSGGNNKITIAIVVPIALLLIIGLIIGVVCYRRKLRKASIADEKIEKKNTDEEEEYDEVDESAMDPDDYYLATVDDSIDTKSPDSLSSPRYVQKPSETPQTDHGLKLLPDYLPIIDTIPSRSSSVTNISTRELPIPPSPKREADWPYDYAHSRSTTPQPLSFSEPPHQTESHEQPSGYVDLPNNQPDTPTISVSEANTELAADDNLKTDIAVVYCEQIGVEELNGGDQHDNASLPSDGVSDTHDNQTLISRETVLDYTPEEQAQGYITVVDTGAPTIEDTGIHETKQSRVSPESDYVVIIDAEKYVENSDPYGDHLQTERPDGYITFLETS